ncbi:hypothetical protein K469DRAFT_691105 [Zopfia rhizophila CBS 207.26]|uniref:F-box domain-containing protein n=1 Tax=Zopfia rhizophila CBS 207.26 TaxID=1314779 RepID=A0A6A6ERY4_9PEZI|nr:hypothetical protein K469DRAFT_691105 [Zopfia rhizophila CBS 207.26]
MLENLPVEIVREISSYLPTKDLKNFSQVSNRLLEITTELLYQSVTVKASELTLELPYVEPLLLAHRSKRRPLQHVRTINFESQFYRKTKDRCPHNLWTNKMFGVDSVDSDEENDEEAEHCNFDDLGHHVLPLLKAFDDNKLRCFTWGLGTCLPHEILGPEGFLPEKQRSIETLRLVTDPTCFGHDHMAEMPLDVFRQLRRFSWSGIRSEDHFLALQSVLSNNRDQLVELELNLIHWEETSKCLDELIDSLKWEGGTELLEENEDIAHSSSKFFAHYILGLPMVATNPSFSNLQVLSLTAVSFEDTAELMASAFNFGGLCSLTLRLCPGWDKLLDQITRSENTTALKEFEIQTNIEYDGDEPDRIVSCFLTSFEGLEKLAVEMGSPSETVSIWRSAARHESTLKRFIHHQRDICTDDESPAFNELIDNMDLSLTLYEDDVKYWNADTSKHPLVNVKLEFLGICCAPHDQFLKQVIGALTASKSSLQVLHIRQSGSDLKWTASWGICLKRYKSGYYIPVYTTDQDEEFPVLVEELSEFARWAFGPDGFVALKILAFGDFSYQGRHQRAQVLLCRDESRVSDNASGKNFRYVKKSDQELWELLEYYSEALESCPADPLFSTDTI